MECQELHEIFIIFIYNIFSYSFESFYDQLLYLTRLPRIKAFTLFAFSFGGGAAGIGALSR